MGWLWENTKDDGGAIFNKAGTITLINTQLSGNKAEGKGGAIHSEEGSIAMVNTTVTGNDADGNIDGSAFIHAPQFRTPVDPATAPTTVGDLRVLSTSPVIDAGKSSTNSEPTDLGGSPRFIDQIDIGAHEFRATLLDPTVFSGSLDVVQLGPGNTPAEVEATLTPSSSPEILVNHGQTNRADYWIDFPNADDHSTGVLMTTVAENGPTNDGTFVLRDFLDPEHRSRPHHRHPSIRPGRQPGPRIQYRRFLRLVPLRPLHRRDHGLNDTAYEQDPVSFVYIPLAATSDTELVAAVRIADVSGTPQTLVGTGPHTLSKAGTGRWFLEIDGHDAATGTLILSPEGGGTRHVDNIYSHEWDSVAGHWIIESRDLPGLGLQNGGDGEPMFSFAFFAREPIASNSFAAIFPELDAETDDNSNSRTNFETYAAGYDPTQSLDPAALQAQLDPTGGTLHLTHTLRAGVDDIELDYLRSDDLSTFVPMTQGIDYIVTDRIYQGPARDAVTIRLLFDPATTPRQFFMRSFSQKP